MRQSANEREAQDAQRHEEALQRLQNRDHREEATLASVIRKDSYSRDFWAHAGSEQIADYATVSAHLAGRNHAEALSAYMHISDVLRNDYGITIEHINRDHPSALMDRHHALRDALDAYFNRKRLNMEADKVESENATQHGERASDRSAAGDGLSPEYQAQQDVDQLKQDSYQTNNRPGEEQELRAAAERAGKNEAESLVEVDRFDAEAHRDAAHTYAEESTGGRQPRPYRRASDAALEQLRDRDPQAAEVRNRTRNNFPESTSERVFHQQGPAARGASSRGSQSPQREVEVTR